MNKKLWNAESLKRIRLENLKKDKLLICLLAGILLLVIAIPTGKKKEEAPKRYQGTEGSGSVSALAESEYVTYLEGHLEELFTQIEGAGKVSVMVTLSSSAEKIVEKDRERQNETVTESDSQGGERTTSSSSGTETTVYEDSKTDGGNPYVSKEMTPRVEGVVVVAPGGDDARVVKNITEAVQALFGIDTHKIRIMKKN